MKLRLFTRRTLWVPTPLGCLLVIGAAGVPAALWLLFGEAWLRETPAAPDADVLLVEGWIGYEGLEAAAARFANGDYQWVVAAGGLTDSGWAVERYSIAVMATRALVSDGVPAARVITAQAEDVDRDRTHASAVAARDAMEAYGLEAPKVEVFTRGAHARRSRLVHARALGGEVEVGAYGWLPDDQVAASWWDSTERAEDFLEETLAWSMERLLGWMR